MRYNVALYNRNIAELGRLNNFCNMLVGVLIFEFLTLITSSVAWNLMHYATFFISKS